MLYNNKIDASEVININKSNKSKESLIRHYWCLLNLNYAYEAEVHNRCHDIS